MTVTYSLEVSQARFWGFPKLLARWHGSIYKLMYREMLVFLGAFYVAEFIYRVLLHEHGQKVFEKIAIYCREFTSLVPITFVLGFYVSFVVGRWWNQYMNIPWPDRVVMQVAAYVNGETEYSRVVRRSLARYLNLMTVLTFQNTSTIIKKRFPTWNHLVDAGIMTPEEKIDLETTSDPNGHWWIPAQWFCQLAAVARRQNLILDDLHLKSLIDECMNFRGQCGMIFSYDWISVPLVYTQVVTIAVYSFFIASIFGRQYLIRESQEKTGNVVDLYVPVFSIFQFFFYVGWLKVAESMICPFGEDDDDFEMNWIVDRNQQVSFLVVDGLYRHYPPLNKDKFWDQKAVRLPYTTASAKHKKEPFYGSTSAMDLREGDNVEWEEMAPIEEEVDSGVGIDEDDQDNESLASRRVTRSKGLAAFLAGYSRSNISTGSRKSLTNMSPTRLTARSPEPRRPTNAEGIVYSEPNVNMDHFLREHETETSEENKTFESDERGHVSLRRKTTSDFCHRKRDNSLSNGQ